MAHLATIDHDSAPPMMTVITPMTMIDRALTINASPETLEKLLALQLRWEAEQSRKAFDTAMASAKAEIQPIAQNRRVYFESKKAGAADTDYKFEDLAQIERQVGPVLTKFGLSYRYRVESEIDHPVRVTCILAHRDGHTEETTLAAGRDSSGNKNIIQAIGSTITYLQRYTLKAALGLAVSHDDDGQKSDQQQIETITEEQQIVIRDLLTATESDEARFLSIGKLERVSDMLASDFDNAVNLLKQRLAKRSAAQ